ncbi:MAG: two-component system sensor histidine kinase BarA [Flavobacteriales bacterium]|jgi:two-component system sensor histidine kinase BarA
MDNARKTRLLPLSAIISAPALLCCSVLTIIVILFHFHSQQEKLNGVEVNAQALARAAFHHIRDEQDLYQRAQNLSNNLLGLKDYNHISLLNGKSEKIADFGLPLPRKISLHSLLQSPNSISENTHYIVVDIKNNTHLIIGISTAHLQIEHFKLISLIAILIVVTLAFSYFQNLVIQRQLRDPLKDIEQSIITAGTNTGTLITIPDEGIYHSLIVRINELIQGQDLKDSKIRHQIDSATKELRESLESVEIQNIELDLARKNALQLSKIKSDFLKKTSQDLRTPLNGILGFSDLLKKSQLSNSQAEYAATIKESSRSVLAIVNDLQDFSRMESGNLSLEKKAIDLISLVEHTLVLQSPNSQEKNINLYFLYDRDIKQNLLGDPLRIQQLLGNLISSAVKFSGTRYIAVSLEKTTTTLEEVEFEFRIKSDGKLLDSLKKEYYDNFNEPLNNKNDKLNYSTSDISLSIARGLAQHMGATIGFEQESNEESYFWFRIALELDSEQIDDEYDVDQTLKVAALVYSNDELSYQEISSRLGGMGIKNQRADNFSSIVALGESLQKDTQNDAYATPIAIIDAQTSQQTIDKIVLTQTLDTLQKELSIPTIVITPTAQFDSIKKSLSDSDALLLARPIQTHKFRKLVLEELGIIRGATRKNKVAQKSKARATKILLVEDNPSNIKLIKAFLKDFNTHTQTATTGKEAIEAFKSTKFDLIFMDIQLPDIDGYEATKKIRECENGKSRTPIIALTAHDVNENKTKLLLAGMDDFISKPANTKSLGAAIQRWAASNETTPTVKEIPPQQSSKIDTSPVNIRESISLAKNDNNLAKDMLEMLIDSLDSERNLIREHNASNNYKGLHEVIHRLHGGCCYCGVPALKSICSSTDKKMKNGAIEGIDTDVKTIEQCITDIIEWREQHDIEVLFTD